MSGNLSQYDITRRMSPYFDPHFMFPVLKWLRDHNIYPEVEVLAAEYELASKTSNMITLVTETHSALVGALKAIGGDAASVPAPEFNNEALQAEFKRHMDAGKGAWDVLGNAELVAELQRDNLLTLEGLTSKGATEAEVDSIFDLARFYHKAGLCV
jgi:translation initiation factor 3 subunit E